MLNDAAYQGREQSYIKHSFLRAYLQAASYKILQGRHPVFNYIDGFAGPWRLADHSDCSDASFDQAIRVLEEVRDDLARRGTHNLKMRFCLCERRPESVDRLRHYAQGKPNFEIHVLPGAFEDNLASISSVCREGFTFTFIDPTGWDIRSHEIFLFLEKLRGEFLLNFMSEHINRHAEFAKVSSSFGRFLADPEWEAEYNRLPATLGNEERILRLLKRKIKASGAAKYVPDFPILKPGEERVKMRLLLGTLNAKGLEVFRDVQERVEREQTAMRSRLSKEGRSKVGLFSDDEIAFIQQKNAGIGCAKNQRLAEDISMEFLSSRPGASYKAIMAHVLESVPIKATQLKDILVRLKNSGVVTYSLPAGKRKPQAETVISLIK